MWVRSGVGLSQTSPIPRSPDGDKKILTVVHLVICKKSLNHFILEFPGRKSKTFLIYQKKIWRSVVENKGQVVLLRKDQLML